MSGKNLILNPPIGTATFYFPSIKLQPEDPGCYESECPPGCQLVLIPKRRTPWGGLYYGIPSRKAHIAVSPNTRLYKSTGQTAAGAHSQEDWALTYYMFHHRRLQMWVIAKGDKAELQQSAR